MTETFLPGPNVCIMGPAGTGKTYSLASLADAGIEVFYIDLENGLESLLAHWADKGKSVPPNVHWKKLSAPRAGLDELLVRAKKVNTMPMETLAKMIDPQRSKHDRFIKLLEALNDFVDDRTGVSYGPVSEWGPERAICIDGLTGLCEAAMSLVVGGKPVRSQPDWGQAQDTAFGLLSLLTDNCPCWFVLIAHVEREVDQIFGGIKIQISSLGKALTPRLPQKFSDVILSTRVGAKWSWDTASAQADLKTRNLPVLADIAPDFKAIVTKWRNRAAATQTETKEEK